MKMITSLLLSVVLFSPIFAQGQSKIQSQRIVFKNVTIVDVTAKDAKFALKTNQTVVIAEGQP